MKALTNVSRNRIDRQSDWKKRESQRCGVFHQGLFRDVLGHKRLLLLRGWGANTKTQRRFHMAKIEKVLNFQLGKKQMFELGQFLRARYSDFLPEQLNMNVSYFAFQSPKASRFRPQGRPCSNNRHGSNQNVADARHCGPLST
jgi:hypothetical protein